MTWGSSSGRGIPGMKEATEPTVTRTSGACRFRRLDSPVTAMAAMTTSRIQVKFTRSFCPPTLGVHPADAQKPATFSVTGP